MFFHIGYGKCQNKRVSDANQSSSNALPRLTLQWLLSSRRIGLSIQDCVELSDLTGDKIQAIAQHEQISDMAALEMGSELVTLGRASR